MDSGDRRAGRDHRTRRALSPPDLPPGTYELRFWHEALKLAPVSVTVKAGATTSVAVETR